MKKKKTAQQKKTNKKCAFLNLATRWSIIASVSQSCLTATPRTVAQEDPLSMEFPKQEYWSELPLPFAGELPHPGIKTGSPALHVDSLPSEPPGKVEGGRKKLYPQDDEPQAAYSYNFSIWTHDKKHVPDTVPSDFTFISKSLEVGIIFILLYRFGKGGTDKIKQFIQCHTVRWLDLGWKLTSKPCS